MKQKPDFTACFVLQGFWVALHHLGIDKLYSSHLMQIYAALVTAASRSRFLLRCTAYLPYGLQYRIGEFVTNRGRLRHFYLRKSWIEQESRQLLDKGGIKQVIILGAGLDVLSHKLALNYSDINVIELDLPDSQNFKLSVLKGLAPSPKNIFYVAGDLRMPLRDILFRTPHFNDKVATLWIAEGLFMFIPQDVVSRILEESRQCSAPDSYYLLSTMPYLLQGSVLSRCIQAAFLKKEQNQFAWSIPFSQVALFAQKHGWRIIRQTDYQTLHRDYGALDQAVGEDLHTLKVIA